MFTRSGTTPPHPETWSTRRCQRVFSPTEPPTNRNRSIVDGLSSTYIPPCPPFLILVNPNRALIVGRWITFPNHMMKNGVLDCWYCWINHDTSVNFGLITQNQPTNNPQSFGVPPGTTHAMTPTPSPKAHCGSQQSPTTAPAFRLRRSPAPAEKIGEKTFHLVQNVTIEISLVVLSWKILVNHRIGWWENLQENPIFDGKNHGFL